MTKTPDPVDVHVGMRIRLRREAMGLNQSELGRALGLTFQQIQKYEKGANRTSASKMYAAAKALGVTTSFFFEGLEEQEARQAGNDIYQRAVTTYGHHAQWDMVEEEALELALEVARRRRDRTDDTKIADEVADVEIMCEQARCMLPPGAVDAAKARKLIRLGERLEKAAF